MISITSLYARSFDLDHIDVFWEIEDFRDDNILAYDFYVLRSEAMFGSYDVLTPAFKNQFYFRDPTPGMIHKWRTLFYKIRVVNTVTNETKDFGPTAQIAEPDLIALEIQRQEDVLFRNFVGRRCWVFPVKTFGPKCTCFDWVTGRRMKDMCLTCFGTGYLGGFFSPIECFIQFDSNPSNTDLSPMGDMQTNNTSGRMISYPPIKPKDVIVEAENKRWRVTSVTTTQRLRADVHQELTLHGIELGDIEYKLPINLNDLRAVKPADDRNFTNPQHSDAQPNTDAILAVYGPRGPTR